MPKITWWQLSAMMVVIKLSALVTYAPIVSSRLPPARDAWLVPILFGGPAALAGSLWALQLARRFPGNTALEIVWAVLGRPLGWVFHAYLLLAFLHWAGVALEQFTFFFDTALYRNTPTVVFVLVFSGMGAYVIQGGMEQLGRIAVLGATLVVGGLCVVYLLFIPLADWGELQPFLAGGLEPVFWQALTPVAVFLESVWVVFLAAPHLERVEEGVRAIVFAVVLNTLVVVLGAMFLITVLSPELIAVSSFPTLDAVELISFGEIIERIEWLLVLLWMAAMGFKVAILLYGAVESARGLVPRVRAPALSVICAGLAVLAGRLYIKDLTEMLNFWGPSIFLPNAALLEVPPLLLAAAALVRRAGKAGSREAGA